MRLRLRLRLRLRQRQRLRRVRRRRLLLLLRRRRWRRGWRVWLGEGSCSGLRRRLTAGLVVLAQLKGDRLLLLLLVELEVERPLRRRDARWPSGSAADVVDVGLSTRMRCPAMVS